MAWHLVRPLPGDSLLVLHAVHLAAGLLDRAALLRFLETAGFDRSEADRSIGGLIDAGLAVEEACLVPMYPGLRRRLEERLGEEGTRLADRFCDHLVERWKSGTFRREVLLFSFLARAGRTEDALRVLPGILRRKIDERDLAGARAFSDPARLGFARPPDAAGGAALAIACSAARLRAAVMEERLEEAGGLVRELAHLARGVADPVPAAEAGLASARYYLAVGDSASALDAIKRGLAAAQDAGDAAACAVREGSLLMGATMLADGRLGEAVEYAGMAEREAQEAGDRLSALRAGSLSAACHFLDGRLTRSGECARKASRLAAALGQREDEVFLGFLAARVRFLLGDLEGCSVLLQRCLCLAELYRVDAAEPVLDAWLARAIVYAGATAAGSRAARAARADPGGVPLPRRGVALRRGSGRGGGARGAGTGGEPGRGLPVPARGMLARRLPGARGTMLQPGPLRHLPGPAACRVARPPARAPRIPRGGGTRAGRAGPRRSPGRQRPVAASVLPFLRGRAARGGR